MSLVFFLMSAFCIFISAKYTFHRDGKAMQWIGKRLARQEIEVIIGKVITIGPRAHLKIMVIILGGLFMLFGLFCLSVS